MNYKVELKHGETDCPKCDAGVIGKKDSYCVNCWSEVIRVADKAEIIDKQSHKRISQQLIDALKLLSKL